MLKHTMFYKLNQCYFIRSQSCHGLQTLLAKKYSLDTVTRNFTETRFEQVSYRNNIIVQNTCWIKFGSWPLLFLKQIKPPKDWENLKIAHLFLNVQGESQYKAININITIPPRFSGNNLLRLGGDMTLSSLSKHWCRGHGVLPNGKQT